MPLLGFRVFPTHTRLTAPRLRRYRRRRYRRRRRALDRAWRRWGDSERLRALSESLTPWVFTASTFEVRRRHARRLAAEGAGGA